ncbi:roadblock/LC7 domain-containing protein [Streptomyces aureocirculatus]|uniref:roadblock/LC7 domain-containing protein n=1 Tax=Streptomyces aureocirculatus TaxID=67275 RepID=UPI0004C8ECCC|nr:roadblock/LC7 domain-containing protein [Streptomyces aureocirculatus]
MPSTEELPALLDDFTRNTKGVHGVIICSRDGLLLASSEQFAGEVAEHFSAITSGVYSLARAVPEKFPDAGQPRTLLLEYGSAMLLIMAAGENALFVVYTDSGINTEQAAYDANLIIQQIPDHVTVPPRWQPHPQSAL